MNTFFSILPADGWQRVMCDALWQSTLIGACGLLAARYFVRNSAGRAWVLSITLTACALVPVASLCARQMGWTVIAAGNAGITDDAPTNGNVARGLNSPVVQANAIKPAAKLVADSEVREESANADLTVNSAVEADGANNPVEPEAEDPTRMESSSADLETNPEVKAEKSVVVRWSKKPLVEPKAVGLIHTEITIADLLPYIEASVRESLLSWIGIAWLAAGGILGLRLSLAAVATWRLLRRAKVCTNGELLTAAANAAQRVGLRTTPRLLVSERVQTPMVLALGRPCLIVPAVDSVAESKINWVATFTHELAHVARGDGWTQLWAELVCVAAPLQPVVWALRRALHNACEEACDDWAVASGTEPVDLADTLTAWIKRPRGSATLLATGMSSTKSRTLRLLALKGKPNTQIGAGWRWLGIPAALLLTAGLAVAQTSANKSKTDAAKSAPVTASKNTATGNGVTSDSSKSESSSPASVVEQAIADDALIAIYSQRIAEDKSELAESAATKSDASDDNKAYLEHLRDDIKLFEDRIEQRKAAVREQVALQLQQENLATESNGTSAGSNPSVVVESGDVVVMAQLRLIPKRPTQIQYFDNVGIKVTNTKLDAPVDGSFNVDSSGEVVLGPGYGAVKVAGLTRREAEEAIKIQLQKTLADPQVSVTVNESRWADTLTRGLTVDAAGRILLGPYGKVAVSGLNEVEVQAAIEKQLSYYFRDPKVLVQIQKPQKIMSQLERPNGTNAGARGFYYVILTWSDHKTTGSGTVLRFETNGDTNVLDAISRVPGLSNLADARIKIIRTDPKSLGRSIIDLNWNDISSGNEQAILPGDRLCIEDAWYDPHVVSTSSVQVPAAPVATGTFPLPQYLPQVAAPPSATPQYGQPMAPSATPGQPNYFAPAVPTQNFKPGDPVATPPIPGPQYAIPPTAANPTPQFTQPTPEKGSDFRPIPNYPPSDSSSKAIPNYKVPSAPATPIPSNQFQFEPNAPPMQTSPLVTPPTSSTATPQFAQPAPEKGGDYRPIPNYAPNVFSGKAIPNYSVPSASAMPIPSDHIKIWPQNKLPLPSSDSDSAASPHDLKRKPPTFTQPPVSPLPGTPPQATPPAVPAEKQEK